jgi:hypothetical protein
VLHSIRGVGIMRIVCAVHKVVDIVFVIYAPMACRFFHTVALVVMLSGVCVCR